MRPGIPVYRERSALHFGRTRRRHSRALIILWMVAMLSLAVVVWQFDRIQGEVLALVGAPPTPTLTPATLARRGYDAYLNGDLERAALDLGQAVRQMPNSVDYLYEYGRILVLLNRGEEGLAAADQAIAAAPNDPRGYALKVFALDTLGRAEEAIPVGAGRAGTGPDLCPHLRLPVRGVHQFRAVEPGPADGRARGGTRSGQCGCAPRLCL